jgi:hypothetical protein
MRKRKQDALPLPPSKKPYETPTSLANESKDAADNPLSYDISENSYPYFELIKASYDETFECVQCGKKDVIRGESFGSHTCLHHRGIKIRAYTLGGEYATYDRDVMAWSCCKKLEDSAPCTPCDHRSTPTYLGGPYMSIPMEFGRRGIVRNMTRGAIVREERIKIHGTNELDYWRSYYIVARSM